MTPQPTKPITLPHRLKRRVVHRRVARVASAPTPPTSPTEPKRPLTGAELAELFKDAKPDPYYDIIRAHIQAARDAEKQKALDEGFPWD